MNMADVLIDKRMGIHIKTEGSGEHIIGMVLVYDRDKGWSRRFLEQGDVQGWCNWRVE